MRLVRSLPAFASVLMGLLLVSACGTTQQIRGNGNMETRTRMVNQFDRIDCSGNFIVFLVQGNDESLKIEADENLFPYIISEVDGDKLILKTKYDAILKSTQPINIYLEMKTIEALGVSHFARLQSRDTIGANDLDLSVSGNAGMHLQLKATALRTKASGSGKMILEGNTTSARYQLSGSAEVMAEDLGADHVEVHASGMSRLHAAARKKLKTFMSGNSKIWYKGNPGVEESNSGHGKMIRE